MNSSLTIQRASETDLEAILLFESYNKTWFSEFLPSQVLKQQDEQYFKRQIAGLQNVTQFLVYLSNGDLAGRFSFQFLDSQRTIAEVSYRVDRQYSNRGIATFTLRRLMPLLVCYGICEVYAHVSEENQASIRVLKSCGFEHSGTDVDSVKLSSGIQDSFVFKWQLEHESLQ